MAEEARVTRIDAARAAQALAGFESTDPRGVATSADVLEVLERSQCFELTGAVNAVYAVTVSNGMVWIQAAKGTGNGSSLIPVLDAVISAQSEGASAIGFQTKRRGLRRQLERRGFQVAGWIMKREIQHVT